VDGGSAKSDIRDDPVWTPVSNGISGKAA
jgi:hypothetical protein